MFGSFARSGFASSRGFGADAADKKDDETITEEVGETERERDAGEEDDVEKLRAEVSEASAQVKDLSQMIPSKRSQAKELKQKMPNQRAQWRNSAQKVLTKRHNAKYPKPKIS